MPVGPVVAGKTLERLLSRVYPHVFGQLGVDEELFAAVDADVVPLLHVDPLHVVPQPVGATEHFSAKVTHVLRFGVGVRLTAVHL